MVNYFINLKKLKFEPKTIDDLILREAQKRDCEKMANLYKNSFPEHILVLWGFLSDPKYLEKEIKAKDKKWLVTELDRRIVGSSALEVSDWNDAAELERIVTEKEMRGNGIAKGMCKALTYEIAEPIGVKLNFAWARAQEYPMQKVLYDIGFRPRETSPEFYVNHDGRIVRENFVRMTKYLNGCEDEIESFDNLIPSAKAIKDAIEKYSGEYGHRNKD